MATTSAEVFVTAAVHATKQRWNATGSSLARMMPNWSCEGVPLALDEVLLGCWLRRWRGRRRLPTSRALAGPSWGSCDAFDSSRIGDLSLLPVIRQVPEIRQ